MRPEPAVDSAPESLIVEVRQTSVPRRWLGAPDSAWNPTLSLLVVCVVGFALSSWAWATGRWVTPWTLAPLSVCFYGVFTVLHDATHGVAHRNRRVNQALGRVGAFVLLLPYPVFRGAHLAHHSHTNDPDRDPDFIVAWRPAWLRPLWLLLVSSHYRWRVYGGGLLRGRGARREALATEALLAGGIAGAVAAGHAGALVQLWLAPAAIAIFFLGFAFDWIPHHPHTTRERYYDTRAQPGRLLDVLLLGQNYHLVHHLWTTIPWYRYRRAFDDVRADLVARGAPIGWRRLAERPPR